MFDPATGEFSADISKRLAQIFNFQYGRKYISPGMIEVTPGTLDGDPKGWVFAHDATTLGGNSGSAVLGLGAQPNVIGLHFGGAPLTANYAHTLAKVKATGTLAALASARIEWT